MFILTFQRLPPLVSGERLLGTIAEGEKELFSIVFRDVDGQEGELQAGSNRREAINLAQEVFLAKGEVPGPRKLDAVRRLGLKAPIYRFRVVKRPGNFTAPKLVSAPSPPENGSVHSNEGPVRLHGWQRPEFAETA